MDFAWMEKQYVCKYLYEIHLKSALTFSFFFLCKFAKSVGENGTPVWEVPVHLKASVLNSGSCLLPATAASSETLLLWWRFENWKRSLLLGLCVCPERACRGTYLHTHTPPGGQFMGMFVWEWLDLVLLGTKRSFTNYSFARNTTSSQWRKTPVSPLLCGGFAIPAICQGSSLQQQPAWEHRDSGNYRCAGCCPLLCHRGPGAGLGAGVCGAVAWSSLPELFLCTCQRACAVSVRCTSCLTKAFPLQKKPKNIRGGSDVGGRGRVLQLFRQFKMP